VIADECDLPDAATASYRRPFAVQTFNFIVRRKDFSSAAERRRRVARDVSPWLRSRETQLQAPVRGDIGGIRTSRQSNARKMSPLSGAQFTFGRDLFLGLTPPGYTTRPLRGQDEDTPSSPWLRRTAAPGSAGKKSTLACLRSALRDPHSALLQISSSGYTGRRTFSYGKLRTSLEHGPGVATVYSAR